jgi:hypothetical protein
MRRRLLVVVAAGLFCGFTVTPEYERENLSGSIALAMNECWGQLKGKAQVEWHHHLRKIDEPARADAVMTSATRSVARCVATVTGSPEGEIWHIVDVFVKHRFTHPRSG